MKVRNVCLSALISAPFLLACLCAGSAHGAMAVIVGPGSIPPLYVTSAEDYRILDGTEIISPSRSGPPTTFVVVQDAIEFRGGGTIQIDGGYFRGGDATYTGPSGSTAQVSGGEALHLRQSTGVVYGGTFIGGAATSTTSGSTFGGDSVILVNSRLTIYDGYFEAGVGTSPGSMGQTYVFQGAGAFLAQDSSLFLHGGQFSGALEILDGSKLTMFVRDYQIDGFNVSGEYVDGTPFAHQILNYGGELIMKVVPEPTTACLATIAGFVSLGCKRRRPASARR